MRTRTTILAALLAASNTAAQAQSPIGQNLDPPTIAVAEKEPGEMTFGVRGSSIDGDEARYQRYRDLRNGGFLDRFRWDRQNQNAIISLGADHVGYRDQRFFADIDAGKLKVEALWDQIPLFFSNSTRTPYTQVSPGVLRLDDSLQAAAEANILATRNFADVATPLDTRFRRDVGSFGLVYSANRELDLKFNLKTARKNGNMPYTASFGFSNSVEVPLPIDNRTTDVSGEAEWANRNGSFRIGYLGSWFNNDIQTLIWDNPKKITDMNASNAYSTGLGPSQSRMALWPNSTLNTVNVAGGYRMARSTRLSGNIAVGTGKQNEALLPHTINPTIVPIPLDRTTTEGDVRTTAANINFSSRPSRSVFVSAKYRLYDLDNRTPVFEREADVQFDGAFHADTPGESEYHNRKSNQVDFDVSFTPIPFTAFRVGYGYNQTDRTNRVWEVTQDNVFRASMDTTGNQYVSLRAVYERSSRVGEGFEEHALTEAGEQLTKRDYDIAGRDRNRVSTILAINPVPQFGVNATVGYGKDDYSGDGEFGLRDNTNNTYSIGLDVAPNDKVGLGLSYGYEKYEALTTSRTSSPGPQWDDPNRNWNTDSADIVRTFDASLSLLNAIDKTDVTLGYSWNRSKTTFDYSLATAFASVQPLPPVLYELGSLNFDIRYNFSRRVTLGLGYWYEQYKVDDFALGTQTLSQLFLPVAATTTPTTLFLNYNYRPYTAHTGFVRLVTFF
ncbi:MAG: MtrB/PioB family decaheme-associated outer membrane protein [Acidobacteria bacterium]|nr:MtrB/PioB family decaheme-associated outer membrane protein [Acidobacteriota bacterium]